MIHWGPHWWDMTSLEERMISNFVMNLFSSNHPQKGHNQPIIIIIIVMWETFWLAFLPQGCKCMVLFCCWCFLCALLWQLLKIKIKLKTHNFCCAVIGLLTTKLHTVCHLHHYIPWSIFCSPPDSITDGLPLTFSLTHLNFFRVLLFCCNMFAPVNEWAKLFPHN